MLCRLSKLPNCCRFKFSFSSEAWSSKEFVELRKKHLSGNLKNTLCDNCWNNKCEKVSPINEKLGVKINELEHSKNIKKEIIHKLNSSKA